ncbi:MAG TPA: zf-HC2 domain-containing protein [Pyrinomonadaceae bacterium]|nr:zf-HC2 domain-containing protein [Pyrinomonadaceae bacterium]
MSCQETQQTLSLYVDDELAQPMREACDEHLGECPLCRAELARMRAVSRALGALSRPVPPADLASSISDALQIEAAARARQPVLPLSVKLVRWLRPRLMPYTVGSFASVLLFTVMFNALRPHMKALAEASLAAREADMVSYKIIYIGTDGPDISQPITPELFAAQRAPVGVESPSLNPRGALAALTRSQSHGHEEGEDDMIVVADVFSNGRASLADVVHPPRDRRMLDEFKDALRKNAAFVPAYYDRRPETMRVVFVVQKVDVPEQNF